MIGCARRRDCDCGTVKGWKRVWRRGGRGVDPSRRIEGVDDGPSGYRRGLCFTFRGRGVGREERSSSDDLRGYTGADAFPPLNRISTTTPTPPTDHAFQASVGRLASLHFAVDAAPSTPFARCRPLTCTACLGHSHQCSLCCCCAPSLSDPCQPSPTAAAVARIPSTPTTTRQSLDCPGVARGDLSLRRQMGVVFVS